MTGRRRYGSDTRRPNGPRRSLQRKAGSSPSQCRFLAAMQAALLSLLGSLHQPAAAGSQGQAAGRDSAPDRCQLPKAGGRQPTGDRSHVGDCQPVTSTTARRFHDPLGLGFRLVAKCTGSHIQFIGSSFRLV